MSQPKTVAQRMATRPKNATQHPGRIVIESQGKRRTAVQKAADDQREKEAKEASHKAVQESYQRIATMQAQMQADQENARWGRLQKTSKTPDSTMDGRQAGAEIVATDKPVVAKGKGQKGRARQLAAGVNVEHPATDEDLEEEPVAAKPQRKKATKPLVRDAIEALNAGVVIDGSTKARDANVKTIDIASTSSAFSKLTRGSTISSNVPPPSTPISIPDAGSAFSGLYASDADEDEYDSEELFTKPLSGFKGKKALTHLTMFSLAVQPQNLSSLIQLRMPSAQKSSADIRDQIIFMNSGIGDIPPPPQLASLGDYKSDSDASHELQAADYDSDLVPPPLAQKPSSRSAFPVDYESLAASQKRKQPPLLSEDDLLSLSSDDEIVESTNDRMIAIKAEPAFEPVSTHRLTSTTNIATTLKAPPAKRLKSESSTTTITGSHRAIATAIATPSKAIARSAFRKKHLPKGCQMANKWAREFIPTAIRCVGDLSEVWTLSDDILCPILQSAWDAVYKDKIPHTVTADGPVIALTLQRLSEWRNSISNVALVVLANFMISQEDLNTDQDRQYFASGLLERLCFLFGDISEDGEMSRPFQSDLLVQVLVQHKCATSGAVNMPGTNNTLPGHSKGALALMERAIKLFANGQMLLSDIDTAGNGRNNKTPLHINPSTGKESSVPLAFSDANWGVQTRAYTTSISRLPDSVVYRNSELAQSLAMKRRGTRMEVDDETEDERALIF
ncbi:hypothetical protein DFJ58DRAFT_846709 [Suillus subalutaceus]|uniref:uncharacterized protein n=1 Tax=Suillus subalutaceus TaxID=48586 RepID=UPI001B87A12C|nr:uncharacterized protein DFJ58DRAFT_846709 [Suillus subalutaceus]KAG1836867.1 hypothetical protein DFJ58DRAFT_846709 [Suillus subalutaceus]